MVDASVPVVGIFTWLKKTISKLIFKETYSLSHSQYQERIRKEYCRYSTLTEDLEYSFHLKNNHVSNESNPVSKLVLKTKEENNIEGISGYVIAKNGQVEYQDRIDAKVHNSAKVIRYSLHNIPLQDMYIHTKHGIQVAYTEICFIGEIIYTDGRKSEFTSSNLHPTYTAFLNSRWQKAWGYKWNLDHLDRHLHDMRLRGIFSLAGSMALFNISGNYQQHDIFTLIRMYWSQFVINILCNERLVNFLFWIAVLLRLKKLNLEEN